MDVAKKLSFEDMSLSLSEAMAEAETSFDLGDVVQNLNQFTSSLNNISNKLYSEIKQHKSVALQHLNSTGGRQAIEERFKAVKGNLKTMQMKELFLEFLRDCPSIEAFSLSTAAAAAKAEETDRSIKAVKARVAQTQQALSDGVEQRMRQAISSLSSQYEDLNSALALETEAIALFVSELEEYQGIKVYRAQQQQKQQTQLIQTGALHPDTAAALAAGYSNSISNNNDNDNIQLNLTQSTQRVVDELLREIAAEEAMAAALERESAAAVAAEEDELDARLVLEAEIHELEIQIQKARDLKEKKLRKHTEKFEKNLQWHRTYLQVIEKMTGTSVISTAEPDQIAIRIINSNSNDSNNDHFSDSNLDTSKNDGRKDSKKGRFQASMEMEALRSVAAITMAATAVEAEGGERGVAAAPAPAPGIVLGDEEGGIGEDDSFLARSRQFECSCSGNGVLSGAISNRSSSTSNSSTAITRQEKKRSRSEGLGGSFSEATLRLYFKPGTPILERATLDPNVVMPNLMELVVKGNEDFQVTNAASLAAFVLKIKNELKNF